MTKLSDESLPEWTEDELALLRSADGDRPRSRSLPSALAAVGAGSALAASTAAAHGTASGAAGTAVASASAKWTGIAAVSKWLAIVAVSGTLAAGAVVLSKQAQELVRPLPATRRPATAVRMAAPALPAPAAAPPVQPVPAAQEQTPAAMTAPERASGRAARARKPASQPDIRVELAALDAVMKVLRAGRPTDALAALDRYDSSFEKSGTLHVEASALRIEALVRAGQNAQASALAKRFLAVNPTSPYAARVRALTSGD